MTAEERPILFSGAMVRAILDGRKTQTRRIIEPQPEVHPGMNCERLTYFNKSGAPILDESVKPWSENALAPALCPYGQESEMLWVRESWRVSKKNDEIKPADLNFRRGLTVMYEAGGSRAHDGNGHYINDDGYPPALPDWAGRLRPSIHMPRWASRITLEITGICVEHLQDISKEDVISEGLYEHQGQPIAGMACGWHQPFAHLWEDINGPGSWEANPWVWALTFKRVI